MNILVTGATRGIGKAIASAFSNKGYNLFVTGRNEELLKSYGNYCVADLATLGGMKKLGDYIQENNIELGEILISLDTAKRQAEDANIEFDKEVKTLIAHGILHLLGFDHLTEDDYNFVVDIQNKVVS